MKKLKMKEVLTKEAYETLSAEERRRLLKYEQAKECSGWRAYPTTCERIFEDIPSEWLDKYSAEHIGEVAALLKIAYDRGYAAAKGIEK